MDAAIGSDGSSQAIDGPPPAADAAVSRDRSIDSRAAEKPPATDAQGPPEAFLGEPRCPANLLLCEDFEAPALDQARWRTQQKGGTVWWTSQQMGGTIGIDATRTARGRGALRAKITGTKEFSQAFVDTAQTFPIAGSKLFVRAFFYVDGSMPSRYFSIFFAQDTAKNDVGYQTLYELDLLPAASTKPMAYFRWIYLFDTSKYDAKDGPRAPIDRWACWEMELDGAAKTITFYVDEMEVKPLKTPPGWSLPMDARLSFGAVLNHDDTNTHPDGVNVWIDEVAVARERIGCVK